MAISFNSEAFSSETWTIFINKMLACKLIFLRALIVLYSLDIV